MTSPHNQPSQPALDLQERGPIGRVDQYTFEPIRGYPMLQWAGKRPFRSTQYYPAQHKESHGPEVDGWRNRLYWGDNLQVMSHLLKQYRGQVRLVYIDPPFDSKADYKRKITLRGRLVSNDFSAFEEKQYSDIWTNDEYLQFMYERLILCRELMSANASIYLHCDSHRVHHLRCLLDEVFGVDRFRNDIVWQRFNFRADGKKFGTVHDTVLFYTKGADFHFEKPYMAFNPSYIKTHFRPDGSGRLYRLDNLTAPAHGKEGKALRFGSEVIAPPPGTMWRYAQDGIDELWQKGYIVISEGGGPQVKRYLDEIEGQAIHSIWTDVRGINSQAKERTDYPTQKPEQLLERIITASSQAGDLVFDCFMGSGTTQAVAMKLGRRFLGADINLGAVQITTKRLLAVASELRAQQQPQRQPALLPADAAEGESDTDQPTTHYTGFEVYNVNNYDVFHNPVQARELLLEALEVNPLPAGSLFDGERDGRMWKLMPVNRIATRQDLNELINGFDYAKLQRSQAEAPNKPVEKITLVCMGHEPDLAAILKQEMQPFLLDVQVLDILRDKQDIQFKRDSEAEIVIRDGELIIEAFYPMTLLSKLSQQKEDVADWRELVDSVMIDWNYDGAVLELAITDIPGDQSALVRGRYPVPPTAGTIRVKITDLLSQSLEVEVRAHA